MRSLFTGMIFLFFCCKVTGQKNKNYLVSYIDSSSGQQLIGYKSPLGKIKIKAQFISVDTDTLYKMAIVIKNGEWMGIDRKGRMLLKPFIYDNGPDYIEEGLFRFVENNKIGFANINGNKIISAQYDFATPFKDGLSEYTLGGNKKYDAGGEHWCWQGGYGGGFVNHKGQEFIRVSDLKGNTREAWTKDKEHYLLNKEGNIIKTMSE